METTRLISELSGAKIPSGVWPPVPTSKIHLTAVQFTENRSLRAFVRHREIVGA